MTDSVVPAASSPDVRALTIASPVVRALTIASSDSGGGAGIQADLKAFARCGVHGASVIVALTAQNTTGVTAIHECPPDFVVAQLAAVLDDLAPAAAKTGMLFSSPIIEAVAGVLEARVAAGHRLPLVIDPVMVASSGARLLRDDAVAALTGRLFPLATVVTPNLLEAQALTGLATEDRVALTEALVALGAPAALVTGGHGTTVTGGFGTIETGGYGATARDHLFADGRHVDIVVPRYDVAATHGAGCTHSAALAACLARGDDLETAARRAAAVATSAVLHGLVGVGAGDGPVDALDVRHLAPPDPL